MLAVKATTIPTYMVNFLPEMSAILPEKGLEMAAETVKTNKINPLYEAPPNDVIKSFNSGRIKLKLIIKKNMERHANQKLLEY